MKIRAFDSISIAVLYFIIGIVLIIKIYIAFSHTSDLAGIEEATFYNIHKIFVYGKLYCTSPDDFPYTITPHTPFYYYFITSLSKLFFNGSQSEMYEQYVFGRLVSIFFVAISMLLIYKSLRILRLNLLLSIILVFVAFTSLDNHIFSMRPDGLKLLISCLYLYFIIRYLIVPRRTYLVLMGIVVSIGFFVKQDEILISAVGSIILLYNKKIKELILYNLFILVLIIAINFILYKFEPFYFENIFYAVAELKGLTHFIEILRVYFNYKYYFIVLLILLLISTRVVRDKTMLLLFLCSVTLFLFSVIISNKWGSSTTYYTDFQIITILCTGVTIYYWKNETKKFILLLLLCLCSAYGFYIANSQYIKEMETDKINFKRKQELADFIKNNFKTKQGEYYYCLDPSFNIFLPDNQLLGAIHTNDIWVYAKFKYKMEGKVHTPFHAEKFIKDLNSKKVPFVIINNDAYVIKKFSKLFTGQHEEVFRNKEVIIYQNL